MSELTPANLDRNDSTASNTSLGIPIIPSSGSVDVSVVAQFRVPRALGAAVTIHQYIQTITYFWQTSSSYPIFRSEAYPSESFPTSIVMSVTPITAALPGFNTLSISQGMIQAMNIFASQATEDQFWRDLVAWDLHSVMFPTLRLGSFSVLALLPAVPSTGPPQTQFLNNETLSSVDSIEKMLANWTIAARPATSETSSLGATWLQLRSTYTGSRMSIKDVIYLYTEAAKQVWTNEANGRVASRGRIVSVSRPGRDVFLEVTVLAPWSSGRHDLRWIDIAWSLRRALLPHINDGRFEGVAHALINSDGQAVAHIVYWHGRRPYNDLDQVGDPQLEIFS